MEKRGPSDDTSAAVPLLEKGSETMGAWNATYEGQMDSHLMVAVTAAADCIVAAWKIDVDTKLTGGSSLSYTHSQPIYVLFNPWCLNDSVYMPGIIFFYILTINLYEIDLITNCVCICRTQSSRRIRGRRWWTDVQRCLQSDQAYPMELCTL